MQVYLFLLGGFMAGWTCMNWATYADYVVLSVVYATLVVFWTRPAFLKPGGQLEALMFSRIKQQATKESDTILYGKLSDYDNTYGQFIYVLM